jgi:hypothetical protein
VTSNYSSQCGHLTPELFKVGDPPGRQALHVLLPAGQTQGGTEDHPVVAVREFDRTRCPIVDEVPIAVLGLSSEVRSPSCDVPCRCSLYEQTSGRGLPAGLPFFAWSGDGK